MSTLVLSFWVCVAQGDPAPPMVPPIIETADDAAMRIGKKLRCPVCQGMPIAESPSQMAQDMMAAVRGMCAQGKSEREITGFFVQRYGEWVLLEPKAEGMNLSLWILPVVALILGVLLIVWLTRSRRTPDGAKPAPTGDKFLDAIRQEVDE